MRRRCGAPQIGITTSQRTLPPPPLFYKLNSIGLDIRITKYVWHKSGNFNQINLHTNLLKTIFGLKKGN